MMDSYVIKVIYEDGTPCRFNYSSNAGGEDLSLQDLQTTIRSKLELPSTSQIKINYKDDEGQFVRMTSDEDLQDALVKQALKPLVLKVKLVEGISTPDLPPPKTPLRWGWGSGIPAPPPVSKVHPHPSDTKGDVKVIDRGDKQENSTSRSIKLVDEPAVCESGCNEEEEPGGNGDPAIPKVAKYKCYECGMNPIVGPWYMSSPIRKQPYASCIYHLCEDCFVMRSWRHSKTIQFKLIKECAECHQYKPDVRRYPFQGNMTRQQSSKESPTDEENHASDDILLCDWCFRSITHRVMDIENRSMSQTFIDSGSSRKMRNDCPPSTPPIEMSELLPPTSGFVLEMDHIFWYTRLF